MQDPVHLVLTLVLRWTYFSRVPHLSVLAEGDGSGLHVQDAGDEITLSEAA